MCRQRVWISTKGQSLNRVVYWLDASPIHVLPTCSCFYYAKKGEREIEIEKEKDDTVSLCHSSVRVLYRFRWPRCNGRLGTVLYLLLLPFQFSKRVVTLITVPFVVDGRQPVICHSLSFSLFLFHSLSYCFLHRGRAYCARGDGRKREQFSLTFPCTNSIESKHEVTILGGLNEFSVKFYGPRGSKYHYFLSLRIVKWAQSAQYGIIQENSSYLAGFSYMRSFKIFLKPKNIYSLFFILFCTYSQHNILKVRGISSFIYLDINN